MDTAVLYESYDVTLDLSMKWHFYIAINTCKKTDLNQLLRDTAVVLHNVRNIGSI